MIWELAGTTFMMNLKQTFSYHVAKCYNKPYALSQETHIFVDANTKAYGAVAYISQDVEPSHIMSKIRVAPIKALTLPKLEFQTVQVHSDLTITSIFRCSSIPIVWQPNCIILDTQPEKTETLCCQLYTRDQQFCLN